VTRERTSGWGPADTLIRVVRLNLQAGDATLIVVSV